jgi:hypothetical protein
MVCCHSQWLESSTLGDPEDVILTYIDEVMANIASDIFLGGYARRRVCVGCEGLFVIMQCASVASENGN